MSILAGYKAGFYISSPPSLALSNEATTDAGDHTNYTITNQTKRYLDPAVAVAIQTSPDGTTWSTPTAGTYTIQNCGAKVIFNTANASGTQVRFQSANYMVYAFLGFANKIDATTNANLLDTTAFTNPSGPWKTQQPAINSVDLKLGKWWIDSTFLTVLTNGSLLLLSVYPGANANQRMEGYGYLKTEGIKFAPSAIITDDLDFSLNGQLYYVAS